ncbi:DUF4349 domain-containing protein [Microbacterium sp. TNHR37B]|uniref:DUF4349 domain-containing protein n=1 Tax=Microbacterium sp. TNHR37B TaxID=1775956 RepID=UPI0008327ECF|nr:DUF4349 domain-containing protein [Microbacterium sp. TNHR37B]
MNADDTELPPLSDARVREIEESLLATIHEEGRRDSRPKAHPVRRRRRWVAGATAAAAVVVAAAVIAPSLPGLLGRNATAGSAPAGGVVGLQQAEGGRDLSGQTAPHPVAPVTGDQGVNTHDREIIATATASVVVDDARAAADAIGKDAVARGGYVEAMSLGSGGTLPMRDGEGFVPEGGAMAVSDAWITVRVPAAQLTEATTALGTLGEVTSSQVDRRDVTSEAVDLRARVSALEASVDRLTTLISQADSTADLLAAEEALSSRQADLESLQQQLTQLEDQVGMSSLTVSLTTPAPAVTPDPAGFGDGVAAGWNGLLVALNALVVAVGFLLPWLGLIALAILVVWLIRRRRGGRARARVAEVSTED